jgi:predicted PurR-regulated permease PerM
MTNERTPQPNNDPSRCTCRVWLTLAVFGSILLLLLFMWQAGFIVFLLFAGILFALILREAAEWLRKVVPVSERWSIAIVLLLLIALIALAIWLLTPSVSKQMGELVDRLPRAARQFREHIEGFALGRQIIEQVPGTDDLPKNMGGILRQALGIFSTTVGAIAGFGIMVLVGLYLAFNPEPYVWGAVHLFPKKRRERVREVFTVLSFTLKRWVVGRFVDMTLVGTLIGVGLWLIDIPLALSLGLLGGILTFIPNLGPILSAVPALLLGLVEGPMLALQVAGVYVAVHFLEEALFMPFIEKRSVFLPPVLVISSQLVAGVFFGILGLALATPLIAAAVVLVKMLYVEDVLGDDLQIQGEE